MRRFVFLGLILGLLFCAQGITMLAPHASAKRNLSTGASNSSGLKAASLQFYYKLDGEARFIDLKTQWQTEHPGSLSFKKAAELAETATKQASVEAELPHWRAQGGPSPKIFTAKLHLYNTSPKPQVDIPLTITVKARVGELRVSPSTQLTSYDHLRRSAQWKTVSTRVLRVPVIAPEEDLQLEVAQFQLLPFLEKHPGQWPESIQVVVSAPALGVVEKQLSLLPDHFMVPTLY
jgi:hypothetical protein